METATGQLQGLGFGQYESQAYVALLQRSPLNGYELAKSSGIPRANIYGVLRKLEDRGAIEHFDTEDGTRYTPVPPEELIRKLRYHLEASLDGAHQFLCQVTARVEYEQVLNAHGYPALIDHARSVIDSARQQLLVAACPEEIAVLESSLEQAGQRGVEITTLCINACPQQCASCQGQVFRYNFMPGRSNRWLVLVPDACEVLAGDIGPGEETQIMRTHQKLLVDLSIGYIRQTIALAAILADSGDRLEAHLSPGTLSLLATIGLAG